MTASKDAEAAEEARLAELVRERLADPRPSLSFEEAAAAMDFDPKDFGELSNRAQETWDDDARAAYKAASTVFEAEGSKEAGA
jgi:hypothetical protein